jgi:hypothetical protein
LLSLREIAAGWLAAGSGKIARALEDKTLQLIDNDKEED